MFGVSLSDSLGNASPAGIAGIMTFTDYSNYSTSGESGHDQSDFSLFKKVYVTSDGGFDYTMSSFVADSPTLVIQAPSFLTLPISHLLDYDIDNVYEIVLVSVPTYNAGASYTAAGFHCVWNPTDGKLYQCIENATGQRPDISSAYWSVVSEANLPSKYRLDYKWALTYDLTTFWMNTAVSATEDNLNLYRGDLWLNAKYRVVQKIELILNAIGVLNNKSAWDRIASLIAEGKTLSK
jgi:hypothetical protein